MPLPPPSDPKKTRITRAGATAAILQGRSGASAAAGTSTNAVTKPPTIGTTKKSPTVKQLNARLTDFQSSFNDIVAFIEDLVETGEATTASQVEVRLVKLDDLWDGFRECLVSLRSHESFVDENNSCEQNRKAFSDRYYDAKSFLLDKLKELRAPPAPVDPPAREHLAHGGLDHVRLPQIKLQMFNGDIDEWLSFRDLFSSLIHSRTDLPEVEKLHYLKGCLQGEPKGLIDPLPITKANYQIAWDTLRKRYDNNKLLKKKQIQTLFRLPTLSKESVSDLRILVEGFARVVQTLDQIVDPEDYKDLLLVNLLTSRLDTVTRRGWEEYSATNDQDTLEDLTEFLQRRISVLESLPVKSGEARSSHQGPPPARQKPSLVKTSYSTAQSSGGRCAACKDNHFLYQCPTFQRLSVMDRDALLKSNSLCRNCFKSGHQAKDCQSKFSCRHCKGRHHTLVCFRADKDHSAKVAAVAKGNKAPKESNENNEMSGSTSSQVANVAATDVSVSAASQQFSSQVLLATAVVIIEDDEGGRFPARALLDSGSESNFITERLSQRLKTSRQKVNVSVSGIGQAATRVNQKLQALVRSRVSSYTQVMSFLVLPKVTVNLPTSTINTDGWSIPEGIKLADPAFFQSKGVDLVLGIESFFNFFVTGRRISLGEHLPSLNESVFGWVVCGGLSTATEGLHINCSTSVTEELESLVSRFWSSEEVGSKKILSSEEKRCEDLFQRTVIRNPDGRYTVCMPKDEDVLLRLGESKEIAIRRLHGTERRLARDADLRDQYHKFMEEYIRLGHMSKVEDDGSVKRCYLPHHPVVKEASTTTKVRVVFDASCKTSSGVSLNDALLAGPVIQEELRSIILRSRTYQIMLVSDVEKMFRQILIHPSDRPLQCILWRDAPSDEISVYELNTVTYGTKSAPFLATRTLNQLASDEEDNYPLAARAAKEDTYMDDVITGANTVEEASELRKQLSEMTAKGGFWLRKWASNCPEALHGLSEDNLAIREAEGINLDPDPAVKTLGLTWMTTTDQLKFQFNIPLINAEAQFTKRQALSVIATLFDPLGLLGAAITSAKILMQLMWKFRDEDGNGLDWDQPLPSTVGEQWVKFYKQLPKLNEIRIDRCVLIPNAISTQIHCFSDASEKAFGCCIYLRSQDAAGQVWVRLLASKSRVAPLKCQTIPRLELCGAVLATELFERVNESIKIPSQVLFWTDSTCVLRWIQASPTTWSTFIANRVAKIQTHSDPCQWRHVPGVENPADLISRGVQPEAIVRNDFWWHGPSWLVEEPDQWPQAAGHLEGEDGEEEKRRTVAALPASQATKFSEWYLAKFSSYSDLVRRTAYWLRLIDLLRTRPEERKPKGFLTAAELKEAEKLIVRKVQKETFPEEWKALTKGEAVSSKSPLRWFNPFISQDEVMRVGGRLRHSKETEDTKHPMILPARHTLTFLIFKHYHEQLLHAGPQLMLATVRLRFWPLGGRNVARLVVHRCLKCFRVKPSPAQQFMGELPAPRVTVSRPFSQTGVDYFGPVYVKPAFRRQAVKAYVAIFVCLATKGVHIEFVSDLTTDRFLQALRRFISDRGCPSDMYSDNGTNFVGARNKLQEFLNLLRDPTHREAVVRECTNKGINWHFTPPSAPHFGGLWEAAVHSAKKHLLRVVGETPFSPEDYTTLLKQVAGCLNSRPLTPMSDDPNDLEPLTPSHFLTGSSLQSFAEPNLEKIPDNRLNYWQLVQKNLQVFWKRWRTEYLCQLQGRNKRWKPPISVEVGKLVVIRDEKTPPMKWKMGRILDLHAGADGVVRVVTLKTESGLLKRPVEKLCFLPLPDDEQDQRPVEQGSQ